MRLPTVPPSISDRIYSFFQGFCFVSELFDIHVLYDIDSLVLF